MVRVKRWIVVRNYYGAHKRALKPGNACRCAVRIAAGNVSTPMPIDRRNKAHFLRRETEKAQAVELGWQEFLKGMRYQRRRADRFEAEAIAVGCKLANAEAEAEELRETIYRLRVALATVSAGLDQIAAGVDDAPTVVELNEVAEAALEAPENQGGMARIDGGA